METMVTKSVGSLSVTFECGISQSVTCDTAGHLSHCHSRLLTWTCFQVHTKTQINTDVQDKMISFDQTKAQNISLVKHFRLINPEQRINAYLRHNFTFHTFTVFVCWIFSSYWLIYYFFCLVYSHSLKLLCLICLKWSVISYLWSFIKLPHKLCDATQ